MPRSPRNRLPEFGAFHVTARGVDRRSIFVDDADRRCYLTFFEIATRQYCWRILAYCLMTNHVHVVVTSTLAGLSRGMQLVNGRYAQTFNLRHARTGHLFQGRFHARAVDEGDDLQGVCAYVFDNPVRAGICETRAGWRWLGGSAYVPATG